MIVVRTKMTHASRAFAGPAVLALSLCCGLVWVPSVRARQDELVDTQIYSNPKIPLGIPVKVFQPRLIPLWLQALERPEHDLKRRAADDIGLAHQRGMPGLEVTVAPLVRALDQPDQHPAVRLATAQALIELDARQTAPSLFAHAQTDGVDMRNAVEPALARWDYAPVRAYWLERLHQPGLASRSWILAIQGLANAHETKAIPKLRELIFAPATDPIVRVEAARALGIIQRQGLEHDGANLAEGKAAPGNVFHLAAALVLRFHRGDEAAKTLLHLAVEAEPAAALIALDALLDDDPRRVLPLIAKLVASPDAGVRSRVAEAFRRQPTIGDVQQIADLMDDPHPQVRTAARHALAEVATKAEFREPILTQATRLLAGERWRALEQSILLSVLLDHKPAAPRLVALLEFERPEVFVTAAWGLRKLAVPDTLKSQLSEIARRMNPTAKRLDDSMRERVGEELSQLCESLGQARFAPAVPQLISFIPKSMRKYGPKCRCAAIWSLGLTLEKAPPPKLVKDLIDRLTDDNPLDPEDLGVRQECAIALGRMKCKESVDDLTGCFPRRMSTSSFANACGWAIHQITGKEAPLADVVKSVQMGWFIEPNG